MSAQSTFGDFERTQEIYERCVCGGTLGRYMGAGADLKCSECGRLWITWGAEEWQKRGGDGDGEA